MSTMKMENTAPEESSFRTTGRISSSSTGTRTSIFDSITESERSGTHIASLHATKKPCKLNPLRPAPIEEATAVDNSNDHIVDVFDEWTEEDLKATLQSEPLISRLYRKLAVQAGLMRPLNEQDYKDGLKDFKGNKEEFDAKFFCNKVEKTSTGYQLHSNQLPFDAHQLFKEATLQFLLFMTLLYFVVLSAGFAVWGWASSCFALDLDLGNALPHGFLLLSGVGDQILDSDNNSTMCLWMNSIAILIGVFVSLPVFGAVVLVRLLDNRADVIKTSDTVLLTRRNGVPSLHMRAVSGNGRALTNFSATLQIWCMEYDDDLEESYFISIDLEVICYHVLGYYPNLIKHTCDENSPLIKSGYITVDEFGLPQWDRAKVMALQLFCNADGARFHGKQYAQNATLFVEPDEKGRLPFFENSTPVNAFHWKKYLGKVSGVNDMSKLSNYKYKEREFRTKQD
jgi:hypothetical protein